jgi:ketosteroid isomerase-like protein
MATPSIEDRFAISDLFVRYTTALDACDVETVVGCFTADCTLESPIVGTFRGHDGIRDFANQILRAKEERGAQYRHVISNLAMTVDGDRARATCYLLDFVTVDGTTHLLSPGRYECDLVCSDGIWLFARRLVIMDRQFTLPEKPQANLK